jgi:hypothetical protein
MEIYGPAEMILSRWNAAAERATGLTVISLGGAAGGVSRLRADGEGAAVTELAVVISLW